MEDNPFLSVIVPVYNSKRYIRECLDSIYDQQYVNFEVILVDDGSTDGSELICDEYAGRYDKFIVVHKKNGGLVSARQAGLKEAKGKYIGFVDSDDYIANDLYMNLCEKAYEYNTDIVICDVTELKNGKKICIDQSFEEGMYDRKKIERELFPRYICSDHFFEFGLLPAMWNKIYRKDLLIKYVYNNDTEIKMGEDAVVFYSAMLDAGSLYYLKGYYGYYYRDTCNSMSRMKNESALKNVVRVGDILYRNFTPYFQFEVISGQFYTYIIYLLSEALINNWPDIYIADKGRLISQCNELTQKTWYEKKICAKSMYKVPLSKQVAISFINGNKVSIFSLDLIWIKRKIMKKIRGSLLK